MRPPILAVAVFLVCRQPCCGSRGRDDGAGDADIAHPPPPPPPLTFIYLFTADAAGCRRTYAFIYFIYLFIYFIIYL
jgi:hypothetical protein